MRAGHSAMRDAARNAKYDVLRGLAIITEACATGTVSVSNAYVLYGAANATHKAVYMYARGDVTLSLRPHNV